MDQETLITIFNEWQRQFIEDPTKFNTDNQIKEEFLSETAKGVEPSYGKGCVATMMRIGVQLGVLDSFGEKVLAPPSEKPPANVLWSAKRDDFIRDHDGFTLGSQFKTKWFPRKEEFPAA